MAKGMRMAGMNRSAPILRLFCHMLVAAAKVTAAVLLGKAGSTMGVVDLVHRVHELGHVFEGMRVVVEVVTRQNEATD